MTRDALSEDHKRMLLAQLSTRVCATRELICQALLVSLFSNSIFELGIIRKYCFAIEDIDVSWVLDARKFRSPRMFFLAEEGRNIRNTTMRLYRGKSECRNEQVYLSVSDFFIILLCNKTYLQHLFFIHRTSFVINSLHLKSK